MEANGTVFVVDDDASVRRSLARLIESVGRPFQTFSTAKEFMDAYDPATPGCLVLDVRMPGISGIELQKQLAGKGINIPIIIITGHGDIPMAADAMRRGAVDFMEKPVSPQLLLDRVQQALSQDFDNRQIKAERDDLATRVTRLTQRERQVVDLAITGMTNKQIATQLGVSPQAIDAHRAKAMSKMHANNVPELVKLMVKTGVG